MNIVGTLCVYADICRQEGVGRSNGGIDADLIAEQQGGFLLSSLGSRSMDSGREECGGGGDDERERGGLGGDGEGQFQEKKLDEVGVWWFVYVVLGVEGMIDSMNKSKEYGFLGFKNSNNSFVSWI